MSQTKNDFPATQTAIQQTAEIETTQIWEDVDPIAVDRKTVHGKTIQLYPDRVVSAANTRKVAKQPKITQSSVFTDAPQSKSFKRLPLLGSLDTRSQYRVIFMVAFLALIFIVAGGGLWVKSNARDADFGSFSSALSDDTLRLTAAVAELGSPTERSISKFETILASTSKNLGEIEKFQDVRVAIPGLAQSQDKMDQYVYALKQGVGQVKEVSGFLSSVSDKSAYLNSLLLEAANSLDDAATLYQRAGPPDGTSAVDDMRLLSSDIKEVASLTSLILLTKQPSEKNLADLVAVRTSAQKRLSILRAKNIAGAAAGLTGSAQILANYNNFTNNWQKASAQVDMVIGSGNGILAAKKFINEALPIADNLSAAANKIVSSTSGHNAGFNLAKIIMLIGAGVLILAAIFGFYVYSYEKENRSIAERIENESNQHFVLKLVHEMIPLQEGDLTKKTTVTDGITGAIAESVNTTIESLSLLVKKMKSASGVLSNRANEVATFSEELLATAEGQSSSLNKTASEVLTLVNAIKEISTKTEASVKESKKSQSVSERGAQKVSSAVESMREIENHMTETGFLMKKVGASSIQISEIADLLSEISEETSILALNATVQSAKSGEVGKGFKIVADAIQSLANRAGNAAGRVGVLITAVKNDIDAVGVAVKKTTDEVGKGVALSSEAMEALNEMQVVSKELSELVMKVSHDAKDYTRSAEGVRSKVNALLETTENTKKSTQQTVRSINGIAEVASELGDSVRSFRIIENGKI